MNTHLNKTVCRR